MKCILCLNNDADQTGSHITSCFFVTSMLGDRDYESGYIISTEDLDYGRDRKADEIKEDNILCKGCEARLSYLEGYFSSEYTNKIDKPNFSPNFPIYQNNGTAYTTPLNVNPLAFNLLINSIIWRAHHSSKPIFARFRIPKQTEKQLRLTLDTLLPPYEKFKVSGKYKKWITEIESVKDIVKLYPYVIMRTDRQEQDLTENIIYFSEVEKNPFHILINEFVILPFMIDRPINFEKQNFFELNDKYDLSSLLNQDFNEVKIGHLKIDDWRIVRDKLYDIVKEKYEWRKIIRDCMSMAFHQGVLPTKRFMKHCIKCKQTITE